MLSPSPCPYNDWLGGKNYFRRIESEVLVDHKILLADDSATVQKIITLTFSDEGVDVIAVNNGDEAINWLHRLRPALVMADISIPGRNGYEICEFVKTHPEMIGTPVILLVPAFEPFDEDRARRIGADYHMTKPFQSIRMLISIVKNLIDRKANAEFPDDDDSTAHHGPNHNQYTTGELNSRRAKIEELIRLSAQPASGNGVEHGDSLKINAPHGNGRHSDPPITSAPSEIEIIPSEVEIIEDVYMDNILELDDVLPNPASMRFMGTDDVAGYAQPPTGEVPYETQGRMVITQSAIDEIVNRVSEQLFERLSGEIARRIAPEVAELVRRQLLAGPALYRESENLLDID
jgi:CheY-like chemotaxis protein